MQRDHVLFLVIGLLTGFIAGYILHEEMATRQPERRVAGQAATATAPPNAPAAAQQGAGGAAAPQVQALQQRLAQNPQDLEALRALGDMNVEITRDWARAADLYERYLAIEPDDVEVLTDLGICYRWLREPERALERFRRAKAIDPAFWQARYNEIIVLAFDLGDLDTAQSEVATLTAQQPANPEVARLAEEVARRQGGGS